MNVVFHRVKGKELLIRSLGCMDSPKLFMAYINALVDENTFILINRKVNLKQEKEWLASKIRSIRRKDSICLVVEDKGRIAGVLNADREAYKMRGNVVLGIALLPEYRGKGLGEFAMRLLIKQTQSKLKPKNIYLRVFANNRRAIGLYRKLGFRKIATLPDWISHRGKYVDEHLMILK